MCVSQIPIAPLARGPLDEIASSLQPYLKVARSGEKFKFSPSP
jgi:hypothetical protein